MKSYMVKEEAKSQLWQLASSSDIRMLADSYLNIYIHRKVAFLD